MKRVAFGEPSDRRFVFLSGNSGTAGLALRLRNTGARADQRFQGEVDLSALG